MKKAFIIGFLKGFLVFALAWWCLIGTALVIDSYDRIKRIEEGVLLNAKANATFADVLLHDFNCKEVTEDAK